MPWLFSVWYEKNKEKFSKKRKLKYLSSKEYRDKAKKQAREYYYGKKLGVSKSVFRRIKTQKRGKGLKWERQEKLK